MSRISTTFQSTVTLDTDEGYAECPADFDIEGSEYPAEPYSWGEGRGQEVSVRAELTSATFGGLTLTRQQVEASTGADHLLMQEAAVSTEYAEAFRVGQAA